LQEGFPTNFNQNTVDSSELWLITWDVSNPVNNGINYLSLNWRKSRISEPSTVSQRNPKSQRGALTNDLSWLLNYHYYLPFESEARKASWFGNP